MIRVKRLIKSFIYAGRGLVKICREEQNFRVELAATVLVLALAYWFKVSVGEAALLIIVCGLVLLMEIVNSAVELISDVLKPKLDNYVKQIKDITAAGVFLAALLALIVGWLVLGPYLF